jgi:hypothetical protein
MDVIGWALIVAYVPWFTLAIPSLLRQSLVGMSWSIESVLISPINMEYLLYWVTILGYNLVIWISLIPRTH